MLARTPHLPESSQPQLLSVVITYVFKLTFLKQFRNFCVSPPPLLPPRGGNAKIPKLLPECEFKHVGCTLNINRIKGCRKWPTLGGRGCVHLRWLSGVNWQESSMFRWKLQDTPTYRWSTLRPTVVNDLISRGKLQDTPSYRWSRLHRPSHMTSFRGNCRKWPVQGKLQDTPSYMTYFRWSRLHPTVV